MSLTLALREYLNVKRCSACSNLKHADDFGYDKLGSAGLRSRCRECDRIWAARARAANRAAYNQKNAAWNKRNKEKRTATVDAWRRANPDRFQAMRSRIMSKFRSDPTNVLHLRISSALRRQLRGKKRYSPWLALVDWSVEELRQHLEKQFTRGMNWENMGEWHIDHIVPVSSFNITEPDDPAIKVAWALSNLRPLWATDNLRKGAKRLFLV